jgi:hypothetical protein
MSLREPIRPAQCALTRTEARYPRKLAVLMNPIWEYDRCSVAAIEGRSIPRAKRGSRRSWEEYTDGYKAREGMEMKGFSILSCEIIPA